MAQPLNKPAQYEGVLAMDVTKVLDWLKLAPRLLFALALGSGLVLFGPQSVTSKLGLDPFLEKNRAWVAIVFLASGSAWVAHGAATLLEVVKRYNGEHRRAKARKATLEHLSAAERAILRKFIEENTKTVTLDLSSGIHAALEHFGIIYRATNVSRIGTMWDYNIQPWAWDYLRKNPHLTR